MGVVVGVREHSGFLNALRDPMVSPGLVGEGQFTHNLTKRFQVEDKNRPYPQGNFFGVNRNGRNRPVSFTTHADATSHQGVHFKCGQFIICRLYLKGF